MPDNLFTLPGSFFTLLQPLHALETDLSVLWPCPFDLRPWIMLTTGETSGEGGRKVRLGDCGSLLLCTAMDKGHAFVGASPPCYSPSHTPCSRPFRPRGGRNHPHTLVPGDSNIPSWMHFNPSHASTKYSSFWKLLSHPKRAPPVRCSDPGCSVAFTLWAWGRCQCLELQFDSSLDWWRLWIDQSPFWPWFSLRMGALWIISGLEVHFILGEDHLESVLNHNVHRQLPMWNMKLPFTFGNSIAVTLRHSQTKGGICR